MSHLNEANILLRKGQYELAHDLYVKAYRENPSLKSIIEFNIRYCSKRLAFVNSKVLESGKTKVSPGQFKYCLSESSLDAVEFQGFGIIKHYPLISIIIVSYNSGDDLRRLLPTISSQSYNNIEIIIIENGTEDTKVICEQNSINIKYINSKNIGFSAANNLACDLSRGEFIALINPDTILDGSCLQEMLDALRYDESAAIVAPKIFFYSKFVRLTLTASGPFSIVKTDLVGEFEYKKIIIRDGFMCDAYISSNEEGCLVVDLPHPAPRSVSINLLCSGDISFITSELGFKKFIHRRDFSADIFEIVLDFNSCSYASARHIINNAGSGIRPDGSPYDRGFAEYDDGSFYSKTYLSAFCGCAALIRRLSIIDRRVFADVLFAYHEDSELSRWVIDKGYKILYAPESKVFHRHSEKTQENSIIWQTLVGRSRLIYNLITSDSSVDFSRFRFEYDKGIGAELLQTLAAYDSQVVSNTSAREFISKSSRTVCIYNTYFSSMGGAEKHALDLAEILQENNDVYLVSEDDFDIDRLSEYFEVNISKCRKIVCTRIDTYFTGRFDIFINSTFRSNIYPASKNNYYIVSFPHLDIDKNIINKYQFIHNSNFTKEWSDVYWGEHQSTTVLPIIGLSRKSRIFNPIIKKSNCIISVGRFTYGGHCKNHHEIVMAFKEGIIKNIIPLDYSLIIVGSCNFVSNQASKYYDDLLLLANGFNIRVIPNAARKELDELFLQSKIYVHATGMNAPVQSPELHEHFGITCHEAMLSGCLPLVYHVGGPAQQIKNTPFGRTFCDINSLTTELSAAICSIQNKEIDPGEIIQYARTAGEINNIKVEEVFCEIAKNSVTESNKSNAEIFS